MAAEHDAEAQADRTDLWQQAGEHWAHAARVNTRRRSTRWAAAKWVLIWTVTAMPLSAAAGYGLHLLGPDAQAFSGVVGLAIGSFGAVACLARYDREGRW
jgi:hypothetical protein